MLNEMAAHMAPKLVRLYDSRQLYDHSGEGKILARRELADAVVDLLGSNLSARESELVSDILVGLIRQAEEDLKQAFSQRLSALEHVPLRVVLHLANDTASVAESVLENSPVLGDMDLLYIVKAQGPGHWQAIARRKKLGATLIDALADTRDPGTAQALADNARIVLTGHAFDVLETLSRASETLAKSLLARPELPRDIATRIYAHVGAAMKAQIVSRFSLNPETLSHIDDVLGEFSGHGAASGWAPTPQMLAAAESMAKKGGLTVTAMLDTLRRGQISSFIAQISVYSGIRPQVIEAILHQSSGARLAGLCRALGIDKTDFTIVFLMTQRMRSGEGVMTQKDLARALIAFEKARDVDGAKYLEACRRQIPV